MNNQEQKISINEKVLNRIRSGDIKMRPKIYFILRLILLSLGLLVLFSFIIYLVSFIVFSLRSTGVWFLPKFGFPGIKILFSSLPWLLVLAAAILIIILEIFAKHLAFVYRRPIVYSLLGVIIAVFVMGFFINKTSLHSDLFLRAREGHLPAIGPFYRDFGSPRIPNVHRGVVSEMTNNGFLMKTPRGEILTVIISSESLPLKIDVKEGDNVVALGERKGNTVQAFDVKKVEEDFDFFPLRQPPEEQMK
jgi:hypothetical protein